MIIGSLFSLVVMARDDDVHELETRSLESADIRPGKLWLLQLSESVSRAHALPEAGEVVMGRAADCDVVIVDTAVSRRHAKLLLGAEVHIQNLGSANGIRMGERKLGPNELAPLRPGEVVQLGDTLVSIQAGSAFLPGARSNSSRSIELGDSSTALAAGFVARDPSMLRMVEMVARVAQSSINVLIEGETGVGKEVVAQTLHQHSDRAAGPFIVINCGALSADLLESELFGHARGAFTGAYADKIGLLESADGGTFFLDEIGELPLSLQPKLLRAIERREVRRVGDTETRAVHVRFVAATHRDLLQLIGEGRFRSDLYYRLNGFTVHVPPLRERPRDIRALANHFLAAEPEHTFHPDVWALLMGYSWPGNVRELRNVIRRAVVMTQDGVVAAAQLPVELQTGRVERGLLRTELKSVERQKIIAALDQCSGNQTKAAKLLGISRRTLITRLHEHGVPRPRRGKKA